MVSLSLLFFENWWTCAVVMSVWRGNVLMRLLDGFGRLFVAAAYLSQPKSNLSILSIEGGGGLLLRVADFACLSIAEIVVCFLVVSSKNWSHVSFVVEFVVVLSSYASSLNGFIVGFVCRLFEFPVSVGPRFASFFVNCLICKKTAGVVFVAACVRLRIICELVRVTVFAKIFLSSCLPTRFLLFSPKFVCCAAC